MKKSSRSLTSNADSFAAVLAAMKLPKETPEQANLRALGLWQSLLAAGKKLPICGGSDYHRDTPFIFLGGPTTCVYALSAGPSDILAALRTIGYDGWLSVEWEKKWHPEIADAAIALPHFTRWFRESSGK